jgi:hypothetical protein
MNYPTANNVYTQSTGTTSTSNLINVFEPRDPTPYDTNYQVQKRWVNTATLQEFILVNFSTQASVTLANWKKLSSGGLTTEKLQGNSGGVVSPDSNLVIQVKGDATSINIVGSPTTNTLTANVILPSQDNSVLIGNISSISGVAPGSSGQLLQCNGATLPPSWVTPTQSGLSWNEVTTTTQALAAQNGYLANNAAQVVFTLPSTASQFSIIAIQGYGSGGWKIEQNANQQLIFGSSQSSVGVTGYIESTNRYDCIQLIAAVGGANTVWIAQSVIGNITLF